LQASMIEKENSIGEAKIREKEILEKFESQSL
jgi:hypothetical protein